MGLMVRRSIASVVSGKCYGCFSLSSQETNSKFTIVRSAMDNIAIHFVPFFIFLLNKDVEGCKWCFTNSDSGRDASINGFLFDDAQERRHEKKEAVTF